VPRCDISFQGANRPVEGLTSRTEMPCQRASLILGRVQREPERLHRPPFRNLEPGHHNQSSSSSPHTAHSPSLHASQSPPESIVKRNSAPQQKHENDVFGTPILIPITAMPPSYGTPPTTNDHSTRNNSPLRSCAVGGHPTARRSARIVAKVGPQ
jgi:hypothetical protein